MLYICLSCYYFLNCTYLFVKKKQQYFATIKSFVDILGTTLLLTLSLPPIHLFVHIYLRFLSLEILPMVCLLPANSTIYYAIHFQTEKYLYITNSGPRAQWFCSSTCICSRKAVLFIHIGALTSLIPKISRGCCWISFKCSNSISIADFLSAVSAWNAWIAWKSGCISWSFDNVLVKLSLTGTP